MKVEELDFEKLKTLAPCTGRYVKMMSVNEVSGYRKFGGCLDAYMDAHLEPNMMETSKQSERTIKSSSYSVQNSYVFVHLKLYIEKEI